MVLHNNVRNTPQHAEDGVASWGYGVDFYDREVRGPTLAFAQIKIFLTTLARFPDGKLSSVITVKVEKCLVVFNLTN